MTASGAAAGNDDAGTAQSPPIVDAGEYNTSTELLASHQDNPLAIAVDAHSVYWLNVEYIEAYGRKLERPRPELQRRAEGSSETDRIVGFVTDRIEA